MNVQKQAWKLSILICSVYHISKKIRLQIIENPGHFIRVTYKVKHVQNKPIKNSVNLDKVGADLFYG